MLSAQCFVTLWHTVFFWCQTLQIVRQLEFPSKSITYRIAKLMISQHMSSHLMSVFFHYPNVFAKHGGRFSNILFPYSGIFHIIVTHCILMLFVPFFSFNKLMVIVIYETRCDFTQSFNSLWNTSNKSTLPIRIFAIISLYDFLSYKPIHFLLISLVIQNM